MSFEFEISIIELEKKIEELKLLEKEEKINFESELEKLKEKKNILIKKIYNKLTPWQITQLARHPKRPLFRDYINYIFTDFVELHGDRSFKDDSAILSGFALLEKHKIILIGHQKGKNTKENIKCNFGMPKPEGYRKALRIMKLAEKFNKPILTFIDTPGAYPGIDAEKRGQSKIIGDCIFTMSQLKVPIISVIIGEGGSGGALALAVADKILMLSYSIYSVISPEGCASILWKDAKKAEEASKALKITAKDLYQLKIIDQIIKEPKGGAHRFPKITAQNIKQNLLEQLKLLNNFSINKLIEKRYQKFINMGYNK